jgi:hypothetical protein
MNQASNKDLLAEEIYYGIDFGFDLSGENKILFNNMFVEYGR